jgi:anaerobic C4-dicarboxylate transporter-like protein
MSGETLSFFLQLAVVIGAILLGAQMGGIGLGLWGGVGLLVLTYLFHVVPTSPPITAILIIIAVTIAAASMEVAGGIDYMVEIAKKVLRSNPARITLYAPAVAWLFAVGAGTAHVYYPLIPVIYELSYNEKIRPERPLGVATVAGAFALMASPVSAVMAVMVGTFEPYGYSMAQILMVTMPATFIGLMVAALVQTRRGKDLMKDPEYLRRLKEGLVDPPHTDKEIEEHTLPATAKLSAGLFLLGVIIVVMMGLFPGLRPQLPVEGGALEPLSMSTSIQLIMLTIAAIIITMTKISATEVAKANTARSGYIAVVSLFGIAWMTDSFIVANEALIMGWLGGVIANAPVLFAAGIFTVAALLTSQSATATTMLPLGLSLNIAPNLLIGMTPAIGGVQFLPVGGTQLAAIAFDKTGTTRVGRFVLNHSFMIPLLITAVVSVLIGVAISAALL